LKKNLAQINQKFPLNYINLTKNYINGIREDIDTEGEISFQILNSTGTVSFDFWTTQTANIGGAVQSFATIFKGFLKFCTLFIFIFWGVAFLKRIFK